MAEKEATEKTLEVMGNPYELAVTLGKIHRPFWGYAYSVFRVLAMILVVSALVFTASNMIFNLTGKTYTQPKYNEYSPSYTDTETEHMTRIGFWEQSDSDSFGGYTYQLEKAALWDRKVNGYDTLCAQIRMNTDGDDFDAWTKTSVLMLRLRMSLNENSVEMEPVPGKIQLYDKDNNLILEREIDLRDPSK